MKQLRFMALLLCACSLLSLKPVPATTTVNTAQSTLQHNAKFTNVLSLLTPPRPSIAKLAPRADFILNVLINTDWTSGLAISSITIGSTTVTNIASGEYKWFSFNLGENPNQYVPIYITVYPVTLPEPHEATPTVYVNDWDNLPCLEFPTAGTYVIPNVNILGPWVMLDIITGGC